MNPQLLHIISWEEVIDILYDASGYIFVSLPGIHDELAQCFETISESNTITIQICIDNRREPIRDGYGESEGVRRLIDKGIAICEAAGNKVSFIVTDKRQFLYFPESKIFSQDPSGYNAIAIDEVLSMRLVRSYFPLKDEAVQEAIDHLIEAGSKQYEITKQEIINEGDAVVAQLLNKEEFKKIEAGIKENPVEHPDIQRQIRTYTAKVQFVEMQFKGGRIENTLVKFPRKALPINDDNFRRLLNSRIKLINNEIFLEENETVRNLRTKTDELRSTYLTPVTCREGKSVLIKTKKETFKKDVTALQNEIKIANLSLPAIVEAEVDKTKVLIENHLVKFYTDNPTASQREFEGEHRIRKIKNDARAVSKSLAIPSQHKLENHYRLTINYYDLTPEDFGDNKLLNEFVKKGIIDKTEEEQIVDRRKAFEAKR